MSKKQLRDKHLGARSELLACVWLSSQGYEVFRNISPYGAIDLLAMKDGKILSLDVKPARTTRLKPHQIAAGVLPIYVGTNGSCEIDYAPTIKTDKPCKQCGAMYHGRSTSLFCRKKCYRRWLVANGYHVDRDKKRAKRLEERERQKLICEPTAGNA